MMDRQELDRHRACRHLGFDIDFRQVDMGAFLDATHIPSGETVTLEV